MSENKYTKADWITATEFAKKHKLSPEPIQKIVHELYKRGALLSNNTRSPMVIRDKKIHDATRDKYLLINPASTDIIISKYKEKEHV
ncbi:MAG: hypothetical protein KBS86_03880 [Proteobacteria bacterium]|nr:hypothetical protein [Candidatus Enterousia scatequi]